MSDNYDELHGDELEAKFHEAAGVAMFALQRLEVALKVYLNDVNAIADARFAPRVRFTRRLKDFDKLTLGNLIRAFKEHSENKAIITLARKITEERNDCAHELFCRYEGMYAEPGYVQKEIRRLEKLQMDATHCYDMVMTEIRAIAVITLELEREGYGPEPEEESRD